MLLAMASTLGVILADVSDRKLAGGLKGFLSCLAITSRHDFVVVFPLSFVTASVLLAYLMRNDIRKNGENI